ncbi:MAG: MerR family transcriptional regulator [Kineosporiaceae bacterium]|nr:MerR family transcriptional regulator [Aeromicrobium sp.]
MLEAQPEKSMQIGEVADRTGMSLRTLRHYDEIGLLQPSARSEGGFRLYAKDDVEKLLVIRRMKPLGFSLDEMLEVMTTIEALRGPEAPEASLRTQLSQIIEQAMDRRERLRSQLAMADEFIDLLREQIRW